MNWNKKLVQNEIGGVTDFVGETLLEWYAGNKRDLPWRNTKDPYKIWISEVILQQTRVVQGLDYYNRFICRFPDIGTLASANEQEVLKYWQGLGYYSRARNLHAAALTIMNDYNGVFPADYPSVRSLKGIGDYIAAAVTSFVWNMPYPVVDGNVFRFLSRLFAIDDPIDTNKGKQRFAELARYLMPEDKAGLFNQAIMEFGALQCVPVSPDCSSCPFNANCLALSSSGVAGYPVKKNKTLQKSRYFHYFHIYRDDFVYLSKREGKDIWQNLYEFPMVETEKPVSFEELQALPGFRRIFGPDDFAEFRLVLPEAKHVLSHRILYADFYQVNVVREPELLSSLIKISSKDMDFYPTHRLMLRYLEKYWNKKQ